MTQHSYALGDNRAVLRTGMRDGIPIALGYLAVSFSLGIAAHNVGLTAFQSTLISLLCFASAGEKAAFDMIAVNATYIEMAVMVFIANARYILMSCALSQRMAPDTPTKHRLIMGAGIVDEIFGITIARPGWANPWYSYGAMLMAMPAWAIGTLIGAIAGQLLPDMLVSAFSVALYGMFIAIIVPPARKNRVIAGIIIVCFALSYLSSALPLVSSIPSGTRTIILTVIISALAAILFPRPDDDAPDEVQSEEAATNDT